MERDEHRAGSAADEEGAGTGDPVESRHDEDELADADHPSSSTTVSRSFDSPSISRPLVKKDADFQGRRLGSYEIQDLLGKGGVGLVYLAFDHRLRRRVALKLLRTNDPEAAARLLEEARAQARVEHENVCQVYEAGEIDGQAYIAMQHIVGRPLTKAFRDMSLEEKVGVIQRVAEGLESAHSQNLIHRDVKPGNVLVEKTPRGEWKPYILDFGLARDQANPGETVTGEVKGTPSYMPPEQVHGHVHSLDARADVYSLGATFYEGITGRQLFPETTGGLAVMLKVLNEDPEPIRAVESSVPIDLESIIMRCLEKDPGRRYPSAQALADDLQRFLDGEPVSARAIGPVTRLWRRMKQRRVTMLTAGLVATIAVSAAVLTASYLRGRAKDRLMEQYRQDARKIEELLRDAYTRTIHDVTEEKADIRQRLEAIRESAAADGRLARGPSNYALGRGLLALQEYDQAYKHLQTAWDSGTRDPEVAYALGRALGAVYEKELRVAGRIDDESQREARLREIEERYREPALDYLRRADDVEVQSTELVEAFMALWEGRHDEALEKAAAAQRQLPWQYEALIVQGEVHAARGREHSNRGDYDEARDAYSEARDFYEQAAERGRSDVRIYEGQCSLGFAMMELDLYGLHDNPQGSFDYGLRACGLAQTVEPTRAEPFVLESKLYWRMGDYEIGVAVDPTDHLTRAANAARRARDIASDRVETHESLGWAESLLAFWRISRGLDPRETAERARNAFLAGIKLDRFHAQNHNGLGYTHYHLAEWEMDNGLDASSSLSNAISYLERAVALEPGYTFAWDNLGNAFVTRARWEQLRRVDPTPSVDQALRAFETIRKLNANYFWAHYGIGDAHTLLAQHQVEREEDPSESLSKARDAFEEARRQNPEEGWVDLGLGRLLTVEGRGEALRNERPEESYRAARENLELAIGQLPGEILGYRLMAELDRHWARWRLEQGLGPRAEIQHGLEMVKRSREIDPGLAEVTAIEGSLLLLLSEIVSGPERRRHVVDARDALERAVEKNPHLAMKYQTVLERAQTRG